MQKQLNISKNILPKIPKFWETPGAAFAELVQNALRAGATEIHIQVNPDEGKLTLLDNGRGIRSLDDFLTIGDSDWDSEIVEPAGIGFYAHFRYSKATTVHSRGKRYVFTPNCLHGAPVEIKALDGTHTIPDQDIGEDRICEKSNWTVVAVEGINSEVLADIDFTRMRHLPHLGKSISFTVNGEAIPNPLEGMTPLETTAGTVYLRRTSSPSIVPVGVWQGLPGGYTYSIHQNLARWRADYVWYVDLAYGVRPKLPGREAFIAKYRALYGEDPNYQRFKEIIAQEVEAYCRQREEEIDIQKLPETQTWRNQELLSVLNAMGIHEWAVSCTACTGQARVYLTVSIG
ncbi:MAG: ATP-binding protein [Anaerolineales bacterium]|jgi:hypothetical protein